jgi:hypothetical protein
MIKPNGKQMGLKSNGAHGSVVVKALRCKRESRGFETEVLPTALGPGVYSACNRNEYQKQKNNVSGE